MNVFSNLLICTILLFYGCTNKTDTKVLHIQQNKQVPNQISKTKEFNFTEFDRTSSFDRIEEKHINKEPLVIHISIPLCDNSNQGIVPVPRKLGNGFDLKNNLYWGAMYGFKAYFKRSTNWELINSEKDFNSSILERVVFKRTLSNQSTVYIVADAYQGDKMKTCLEDYLNSVAGQKNEYLEIDNRKIGKRRFIGFQWA